MQESFVDKPELIAMFKKSLSAPRFGTYLIAAQGNEIKAIELYQWNALVAQSLYIYLQSWEVCLRNKIADFLIWKYKEAWPYDQKRALRNLKRDDKRRLDEAIVRQERNRGTKPVPTSVIIADLPVGFWVSQLSSTYDVPYSWRYNLARIFPFDAELRNEKRAWEIANRLLTLRNRIAHHEPIFHIPLDERHKELHQIECHVYRYGDFLGSNLRFQ